MQGTSRTTRKAITFGLVAIAMVCAVVGIIYLTITAPHLPSFIPGAVKYHPRHARHFTKRGVALVFVAVVALVGAWYTSATRRRRLRYY